jgi:acetyl esterase/lipase
MRRITRLTACSLGLCLSLAAVAFGQAPAEPKKPEPPQAAKKTPPERPAPTVADFVYAKDSERQKLDFWQAESDKPTPFVLLIHGGGWKGGDKSNFGTTMIKPFLDEKISVAAINYRFIMQAMEQNVVPPVKAPLHDAALALQTIRAQAKEWNLDPTKVGATGVSAGACTSLWLALHDDLADPKSSDRVKQQSTRLQCAAVSGAQTSLDPKELREWMPNSIYGGHAFGFAGQGRSRADEFELLIANRDKVLPWIKEYSPIELVSQDDPPLFLEFPSQRKPPVMGEQQDDPTHSALYGLALAERMKPTGVECVVTYPGQADTKYGSLQQFLITKLKGPVAQPAK